VEDLHGRYPVALLELGCDPATHPEVAVQHVIARAMAKLEAGEGVAKRGHVGPERVLQQELRRAGIEMDDAHAGRDRHDLIDVRAVPPDEDVDRETMLREIARYLGDVDV